MQQGRTASTQPPRQRVLLATTVPLEPQPLIHALQGSTVQQVLVLPSLVLRGATAPTQTRRLRAPEEHTAPQVPRMLLFAKGGTTAPLDPLEPSLVQWGAPAYKVPPLLPSAPQAATAHQPSNQPQRVPLGSTVLLRASLLLPPVPRGATALTQSARSPAPPEGTALLARLQRDCVWWGTTAREAAPPVPPCVAGSYCSTFSSAPITCPACSYCPAGSTAGVSCVAGNYCPSGSSSYVSCAAGYYCPTPSSSHGKVLPRRLNSWCLLHGRGSLLVAWHLCQNTVPGRKLLF